MADAVVQVQPPRRYLAGERSFTLVLFSPFAVRPMTDSPGH